MESNSDRVSSDEEEYEGETITMMMNENSYVPLNETEINELTTIRNNDPIMEYTIPCHLPSDCLEQIGLDISNNTHLEYLNIDGYDYNEYQSLFRGLSKSASIEQIATKLTSTTGRVGSIMGAMVPFIQNATNFVSLCLDESLTLQSEGFDTMIRALTNTQITYLYFNECGIDHIEIDLVEFFPRTLKTLELNENHLTTDSFHAIAKLLQEGFTLEHLGLMNTLLNDEGLAPLIDALQNNTTLKKLDIFSNDDLSKQGILMLRDLVCGNSSSVKATLQSNHTLTDIAVDTATDKILDDCSEDELVCFWMDYFASPLIQEALKINKGNINNPDAAGREKVVQFQLKSTTRARWANHQSLYCEIDSLHLPEVLSLVSSRHGLSELYVALKASIEGVMSIVNRKLCLQQKRAFYAAKVEEIDAELAAIDVE